MNWMQLFEMHTLKKGYDYFCQARVNQLKRKGEQITATVRVENEYKVTIVLKEAGIESMTCHCKQTNGLCEHIVATLFAWESEKEYGNLTYDRYDEMTNYDFVSEQGETYGGISKMNEIRHFVLSSEETFVKSFLIHTLKHDEQLFMKFKDFMKSQITQYDVQRSKKKITHIFSKYLRTQGWICEDEIDCFLMEMEVVLDDVRTILKKGHYIEAFELSSFIFLCVADKQNTFDVELENIVQECIAIWNEIFEYRNPQIEQTLYNWFIVAMERPMIDYMAEELEEIVMNRFTDDYYLEKKLKWLDVKLKKLENHPSDSVYEIEKWVMYRVELMRELGYDWKQIEEYCKQYWELDKIRNYIIYYYIEQKRYRQAIQALEERIKIESCKKNYGVVVSLRIQLKEVYRMNENMKKYKEQLWLLVTKDDIHNLNHYRELKQLYSEEEWIRVREEIFHILSYYMSIEELYREEKLEQR